MRRILIVDAHGVYRNGLRLALQILLTGSQIIEADSLNAARKELDPDGTFDLVLVDVDAPDAPLEKLSQLRNSHPRTRLAALSAVISRDSILRCLEIGLFGFIAKCQSDEEIFSAVKDILSGRIYVPPILSQSNGAIGYARSAKAHAHTTDDQDDACDPVSSNMHPEKLTRRQREILPLLAKGMSNKEIARALKIAEGTTKIHASGLLRVLGVRNRTEAAVVAKDYILAPQSSSSVPVEPALRASQRK